MVKQDIFPINSLNLFEEKSNIFFIKINQTLFSDTPKPFGSDSALEKMGFERSIGFGSPESKFISKSATESSTIIVEKRDEMDEVVDCSPVKSVVWSSKNLNSTSQIFSAANTSSSNEPLKTTAPQPPADTKLPDQTSAVIAAKKNLDYSSVTFNPIGQSKPAQNLTALQKPTISKPVAKPVVPTAQSEQNKTTPVQLNRQRSGLTKNLASNISVTKVQDKPVSAAAPVPEPVTTPTAVKKTTPVATPWKNDQAPLVPQNLLVPLKIQNEFQTKIVSFKSFKEL